MHPVESPAADGLPVPATANKEEPTTLKPPKAPKELKAAWPKAQPQLQPPQTPPQKRYLLQQTHLGPHPSTYRVDVRRPTTIAKETAGTRGVQNESRRWSWRTILWLRCSCRGSPRETSPIATFGNARNVVFEIGQTGNGATNA